MMQKWIITILLLIGVTFGGLTYCAWGIYRSHGTNLQAVFDGISKRQTEGSATFKDRLFLRGVYATMIYGGIIPYPEAALILQEYLYGTMDTLELSSHYFKGARFIKDRIGHQNDSTIGPIYLRLSDDKRIAYAINGFFIDILKKETGRHFRLYQDIVFNKEAGKAINTSFNIFGAKIRIPDKLVHVIKTRKNDHLFVYAEWDE